MTRQVIKKWGNSLAVRIPAVVMEAAKLTVDQTVNVRAQNGHVIIEPAGPEFTLDALLAGITPENQHGEVDIGAPVGRERI
ncbi:MAG: AbrB/MazE/SpoVT family DNA-binding domain-containing protein [Candidatus Competibacteraceae bacterium]|nr:AbrB/MazE/SpoVT family DNA-binding domain-containing protein [Candidatus Competibacteraceae bacterium]